MRPAVLITDPLHPSGVEALRSAGVKVDYRPGIPHEELLAVVGRYDALIVRGRTKVTREILEAGRGRLRAVCRAGVGLDNIDLGAAKALRVRVFNTPEASTEAVAELTVALMLSLARRLPYADRSMKEGRWAKKELMGFELKGKTLGIVGFGRIGQRVAEICSALGMRILAYRRTRPLGIEEVLARTGARLVGSLEELLRAADIITLHVPLTPQTRHMIGEREIAMMKEGAILINTSRGGVIDEEALYRALVEGKLAAAALDVFEEEPPRGTSLKLAQLPNVVATPHIGAQTVEAQETASRLAAQKLLEFFRSEGLLRASIDPPQTSNKSLKSRRPRTERHS